MAPSSKRLVTPALQAGNAGSSPAGATTYVELAQLVEQQTGRDTFNWEKRHRQGGEL